jgi:hypothetical protein
MEQRKLSTQKLFNIPFITMSAIVLVIAGIRCVTIPLNYDEALTFYIYVQSGHPLTLYTHYSLINHISNSFLSWICYSLFGDSPFFLRLPNLLALLILIIATGRISKHLTHFHSKIILATGFLLSFYLLNFYSLCRGYGLSTSFLVLSASFLIDYFNSKNLKSLFIFYLLMQLAISANLVLVIVAIAETFVIILFQFRQKEFLKKPNIILLLFHLSCLSFWVSYSFFLQTHNVLYDGGGKSYWESYTSLINMLVGEHKNNAPLILFICFTSLVVVSITKNFKKGKSSFQYLFTPSPFYTLLFACLIAGFYVMNILLHVNYPQNRTALFFYVFFILSLAFTLDMFRGIPVKVLSYLVVAVYLIHFTLNVNFSQSLYIYKIVPEKFYTHLLQEQKLNQERITISYLLEPSFDFLNYCHNGALNCADASDGIQMNCDYVISWKALEQYYKPYYDVIDEDVDGGQTLLKRKEKIKRNLFASIDTLKPMAGHEEFYNLYGRYDTCLKNNNPLLAECNIAWIKATMPLNAYLVFQIDTADGQNFYYKRIPLNWIRNDLSKLKNETFSLVSGPLPSKIRRISCYIWNIDRQEMNFKVNSVKIFQLEGNGVNIVTPIPHGFNYVL